MRFHRKRYSHRGPYENAAMTIFFTILACLIVAAVQTWILPIIVGLPLLVVTGTPARLVWRTVPCWAAKTWSIMRQHTPGEFTGRHFSFVGAASRMQSLSGDYWSGCSFFSVHEYRL